MAAAWRLVGLRLELMLHLLEQAPLRCDQFAQVTEVIAEGNRHQCERTGRRCGAALHPSIATPSFWRLGVVCRASPFLAMKQCSSLLPFRKHRFTRQDSQDNEHECSVLRTNTPPAHRVRAWCVRVTLDDQNVCLLPRVPCLVVAGADVYTAWTFRGYHLQMKN